MDFAIKAAEFVGNMNINVLLSIGIFIVFLILLILKGSILQLGLRLFTKKKHGFYFMIIPTFLAIVTNMILLFASYIVITRLNINIVEILIQYLFNSLVDFKPILNILLVLLAAEVIFIIIEAFILKLVTFDICDSIKKLFSKIFKKAKSESDENNEIENNSNYLIEVNEEQITRPSFINGLLAGLFCFSIMFFLTIILLYIGETIGSRFII